METIATNFASLYTQPLSASRSVNRRCVVYRGWGARHGYGRSLQEVDSTRDTKPSAHPFNLEVNNADHVFLSPIYNLPYIAIRYPLLELPQTQRRQRPLLHHLHQTALHSRPNALPPHTHSSLLRTHENGSHPRRH
jgi:hypothetical protein